MVMKVERDMGRLKHLVGAGRSFSYSKYSYLRDIYLNRRNKTSLGIRPQNMLHTWRYVPIIFDLEHKSSCQPF